MLMLAPYIQHQYKDGLSLGLQVMTLRDGYTGICIFITACLEARHNFHILKIEQYLLKIIKIFVNGHHHSCWCSLGLAQPEGRIGSWTSSAQVRDSEYQSVLICAENECILIEGEGWTQPLSSRIRRTHQCLDPFGSNGKVTTLRRQKRYQASQKCDLISVAWKWRKIGRVNFKLCPHKHWTFSQFIPKHYLIRKAQIAQLCLMFALQNSHGFLTPSLFLRSPYSWNMVI